MIPVALMLAATLQAAPPEPPRAELCLAHMNVMIADAMRETGRVAGPSWFIRDWWDERASDEGEPAALTTEQRTALEASLTARKTAEPESYQAELTACVDEAIEGGALP